MDTATEFRWRAVNCSGKGDESVSRSGCTLTLVGSFVWVISGVRNEKRVSVLDTEALSWKDVDLSLGDTIFNPYHHSLLIDDKIIIFGVRLHHGHSSISRDIFALDVVTDELRLVPTFTKELKPLWPIYSTAAFYEPTSTMAVVIGAVHDSQAVKEGSLHLLNMDTLVWTKPQTKGREPVGNRGPALRSYMVGSKLLVYSTIEFGGLRSSLCCLDLAKKNQYVWTHLYDVGERISRYAPALTYVGNGRLIIFGGFVHKFVIRNTMAIAENAAFQELPLPQADANKTVITPCQAAGDQPTAYAVPQMVALQNKLILLGRHAGKVYFLTPN